MPQIGMKNIMASYIANDIFVWFANQKIRYIYHSFITLKEGPTGATYNRY